MMRRRATPALLLVCVTLLAGCASGLRTTPVTSSTPASTPTINPVRNDVAMFAMSLLNSPYVWGGKDPDTGFDCSGMVTYVYRQAAGLKLQGNAVSLGKMSRPVAREQLQPGDLVFFNTLGTRHSHVGVYVGNDRFVHASNPRTGVRIDQLSSRYYAQRFEGAHTLLD